MMKDPVFLRMTGIFAEFRVFLPYRRRLFVNVDIFDRDLPIFDNGF